MILTWLADNNNNNNNKWSEGLKFVKFTKSRTSHNEIKLASVKIKIPDFIIK